MVTSIFSLSREDFEEVYAWMQMYINYKNKKGFNHTLRYAFFKFGGKNKCIGWKDETVVQNKEELWNFIEKNDVFSISQTLLPNEIVLEIDKDDNYEQTQILKFYLDFLGMKYIPIYSGGNSIHFHVLFSRPLHPAEKNALKSFFSERVSYGFDEHGFWTNHPWRLPFTYHPETKNKAMIIVTKNEELDSMLKELVEKKSPEILEKFENDIDLLLNKMNIKVKKEEKKETNPESIKMKIEIRDRSSNLKKAFEELKSLNISDGRYRVLLILTCLAKKMNMNPLEFEKEITEWWQRNYGDKKQSFLRNWIKYYQEGKEWMDYFVSKLTRVLQYYENTKSDINEEDRRKIEEVLEKYFGKILEKIRKK